MDQCTLKLLDRLDKAALKGQAVDMKSCLAFLVTDVLGELSFSRPFGVLDSLNMEDMPPIERHVGFDATNGWVCTDDFPAAPRNAVRTDPLDRPIRQQIPSLHPNTERPAPDPRP